MSNELLFADNHESNHDKKKPFQTKDASGDSYKKRKNAFRKCASNPKHIKGGIQGLKSYFGCPIHGGHPWTHF
jgi:hypothetical protein